MHEGPMVVKGLSNKIRDGGHQIHNKKKEKKKRPFVQFRIFWYQAKAHYFKNKPKLTKRS